jgi:Domain of unknown function (DUF4124)
MHPRGLCIVVGLLAALAAQAAVVYRWVDPDGVVHYSDQPVPGAEKIVTAGKSSLNGSSAASAPANPSPNGQQPRADAAAQARTAAATIVSPQTEQNFFNDEPINVVLSQRELKPDQSVTWHLNGRELADQSPTTTAFVLPNPGRGTFAIAAIITNQTTGEVQSTPSVTFYVHEPSLLSPQHRNP